ncbi:MAG: hypothetical protein RMJ97_01680 [Raineya sp.]|nr:hypothetical protein [Raineya sp.]MDW8295570.1 hypothetical protein [Raineya sp.]
MYNERAFLEALSESFVKYLEHGPRSTEKLKPLHTFWANFLQETFGENFQIHHLNNKELTIEGKYYPKDVDIAVTCKGKPVFCMGIKFVTSNYKQNANNYFENMMGETANIQRLNIPYVQLIILRYKTPYYSKSNKKQKNKKATKIEIISQKDLQKYVNLAFDIQMAHKPYVLAIFIVEIDETTNKVSKLQTSKIYDVNFAELLESKVSVENLCREIENFAKLQKV